MPSPFGEITFRKIDHQSTLGAYVGKTALKDGKGVMVDSVYRKGARLSAERRRSRQAAPEGVSCSPSPRSCGERVGVRGSLRESRASTDLQPLTRTCELRESDLSPRAAADLILRSAMRRLEG